MSGSAHAVEITTHQPVASIPSFTTPPSPSSPQINILRGRKRPREHESIEIDNIEPLLLWPYPRSQSDPPVKAWPQFFLSRAQLPLSYLDPETTGKSTIRTRFLTSTCQILGLQDDHDNLAGSRILVARLEPGSAFYAVDRLEDGLYSVCKLRNCISPEQLQTLGGRLSSSPSLRRSSCKNNVLPWWSGATLETPSTVTVVLSEEQLSHRPVDVYAKPKVSLPVSTATEETRVAQPDSFEKHDGTASTTEPPEIGFDVEEMYSNIIKQYLDMLYLSKTSLAYFAKGPLSRARAMSSTADRDDADQPIFPHFLRSLVMGMSILDKKYKESIPAIVKKTIPIFQGGGNNESHPPVKSFKRRKNNKLKHGKDGLFPGEVDIISKWWINHDSDLVLTSSIETLLTTRLTALKLRETLLQLMLTLEALALEISNTSTKSLLAEKEVTVVSTVSNGKIDSQKPARLRNSMDLDLLVDSLVDRLSIWQSIETVTGTIEKDSKVPSQSNDLSSSQTEPMFPLDSDHLKDFYTEVLIPFYAARLPVLVQKLARSFGAVAGRSPSQYRAKRSSLWDCTAISGAEKTIGRSNKTRKHLARIATDIVKPAAQIPSLTRSATDSMVDGVRREKSATPRMSFDFQENRRSLSRSSSITQSKILSQREVDFGFISKFNESKARRKQTVEEELQEAILTMKKPNRELAVKELVDAAESRKLVSRSNKTTSQGQRRPGFGVQVDATPQRLKKTKNTIYALPNQSPEAVMPGSKESISTSNAYVPSSAIRPVDRSAPRFNSTLPIIETPTRGNQKFSQLHLDAQPMSKDVALFTVPSTSSRVVTSNTSQFKVPEGKAESSTGTGHSSRNAVAIKETMTPTKNRMQSQAEAGVVELHMVATPIKRSDSRMHHEIPTTPWTSTGSSIEKSSSIYDSLGWNDGDDTLAP